MGIQKEWHNKQKAEKDFALLKDSLFESLTPYFAFSGKLDLSVNDPSGEIADTLARILNAVCKLVNEKAALFGADSILAQQVIVEENRILKYWGKIFWLLTPSTHKSYKPSLDPFYGEFLLKDNEIQILNLKFGDQNCTNLDKIWWFDMQLDWVYEFEQTN
ncbi:hypothetical protein KORDIASMS9_04085 [Kordia sp. SMS9]|uniref:hypothetical protein n=1 Tax=Kordia sp. SMS9 TaxID=2282170 RepID=UPI000E0D8707|nr:hypothetical protein [Kordia sp. SMS9]AXG71827.1 hypothetical protein KORDIASMS9_04085 [Kordia sp. SMS9]